MCGIDISVEGQKKARRLAADHGVSFDYIVCDVNDFDFGDQQWDMIVSIFAHTDPQTRRKTLGRVAGALKENGVFVLEAYHPRQLTEHYKTGGPQDVSWQVALDELMPYFSRFEILHQAEKVRVVHEGSAHTGEAFVTQFIVRKKSD